AGWLGRREALRARVPVVAHTFHGHVLRDYFPRPLAALARWRELRWARQTDLLFAVSPSCREELRELAFPAMRVVPPAVDLAGDLEEAYGTPGAQLIESEDGRAVFFVGRADATAPVSLFRVGIVDGTPTPPVEMAQLDASLPNRIYGAPDGGSVAWTTDIGELWLAHYGDGEPQAHMLSTPGYVVEASRPPIFLARPE
ncbi:MAG: glycosyltransferase family 4 protein, partial [Myxococcota bacterium]